MTERKIMNIVSLHWLQGSIPYEMLHQLTVYISGVLGETPEDKQYGQFRFDRMLHFPLSECRIYYDSTAERAKDVHNGRILLQINGSTLDTFNAELLYGLCCDMVEKFCFKATRIDCAFDDYSRNKLPSDIYSEGLQGSVVGYRTMADQSVLKLNSTENTPIASCVTFGRRGKNGSGKFLRVYDKNLESDGETDCIRWEVEFTKKKAQTAFYALTMCADVQEFANLIGAYVGGAIDFVERTSCRTDRCQRLGWWADMVLRMGRVCLKNPKIVNSVKKSKKWVEVQVGGTLGMLRTALGHNDFNIWFENLVSSKEMVLSDRHRKVIERFLNEVAVVK